MNLDGVRHYREGVAGFSRNARLYIAGGIFNGLGMSVFGLLFNLYLKEHAFTESQIGQVLSAGSLGATLAAIPAALVLERICVKRVLIWSTLLAAGCYAAMIALRNMTLLLPFSLAASMFITFYRISAAPYLMAQAGSGERIYVFSISSASGMLSSLIGFVLGGFLPELALASGLAMDTASAQEMSLYFSIAASLLSLAPFAMLSSDPPACSPRGGTFVHKLKSYDWPVIWRLMVPKILVGLGAGLVIPFMNLYFRNEFDLESGRIGLFFSVMQVGLFLGMLSAPLLTRRLGKVDSIVLTELASVPFMLVLALTRNLPLAVFAFVMRGTLMNMNLPIAANFEMELLEEKDRPFTNAVSTIAWNGAWTISAAAGGAVIEKYSFAWSFYLTIGFYLLSAASYKALLGRSGFRQSVGKNPD
ncbi:MFS transporter [Candidatus Fermentibacteria bacterium]|nr:MFS transporter [Candidatus Fermentibacteria bacterium]